MGRPEGGLLVGGGGRVKGAFGDLNLFVLIPVQD